jgi:hypothetical protein
MAEETSATNKADSPPQESPSAQTPPKEADSKASDAGEAPEKMAEPAETAKPAESGTADKGNALLI